MVIEWKALAAPMSNRPVFVPKAAVREAQPAKAAGNRIDLVMSSQAARQSLPIGNEADLQAWGR